MISESNKPQGVSMRKYRTVAIPIDVLEELKKIANQRKILCKTTDLDDQKLFFQKTLTSNYYLLYLIYILKKIG